MTRFKTLDELAKESFVVVDTSALTGSQESDGDNYINGREIQSESDSLDLFIRSILSNPGRVLTTEEIVKEYICGKFNLFKKHKLADLLRKTGGIVNFDGQQKSSFDMLWSFYSNYRIAYGLSEADMSIATSGIVIAKYQGSTTIITRDKDLSRFVKDVAPQTGIDGSKLKIFSRRYFDAFEMPSV